MVAVLGLGVAAAAPVEPPAASDLFTQDSIKIVGSTWMCYIESGFFD